jgi:hypothetical protein
MQIDFLLQNYTSLCRISNYMLVVLSYFSDTMTSLSVSALFATL